MPSGQRCVIDAPSTWLSLVELLPSRARLRQRQATPRIPSSSREPTSTRLQDFRLWIVLQSIIQSESYSRATENYRQSRRAAQVVRLPEARWADPETKTEIEIPIQARAAARLRRSCRAPVRVRAVVADRGLLRLRHAACRLSDMWCESGAASLVRRQGRVDLNVAVVFGRLGQAALVEGRGRSVRHDVAERVSLRNTRSFVRLAHRGLSGIEAIGVDEVQWQPSHKYLTPAPVQTEKGQIDNGSKRL